MENYSDLHRICVQVFEVVSRTTTIFVLPLFMMRIVSSNVLGEGSKAFQVLRSVIVYFCLIAAFPFIIELLFSIPESYLPKMNTLGAFAENSPEWNSVSVIPFAVDRILEVLLAGLYWLAYYLHIFFMIVMCSMAPIVILSSTMLGLGLGLEIFMGLLIVGSSWPIIWYGFDQVHSSLVRAQTDEFGAKCLELLLTFFKGLSPIAFAAIAIKSPPGKAISRAAQAAVSSGKWVAVRAISIPKGAYSAHKAKSHMSHMDKNRSPSKGRGNAPAATESTERLLRARQQKQRSKPNVKRSEGVRSNENTRPRNIQT